MMRKILAFLSLVASGLCSCEGYSCATGCVKDKDTGVPLDSVAITLLSKNNEVEYADSAGCFDVCNKFGGCVPDCRDITLQISRPGYFAVTLTNPEDSIFLLERE